MNNAKIWFRQPAARFEEALPIGAGRFGAMLYGDPDCEILRLNEDSVWSGGARSRVNPEAKDAFPVVRSLIKEGKIATAEKLAFEKMQGCTPNMRHYMPLGDLTLRLTLPDGEVLDYIRTLSLDDALYTVTFSKGGAQFRREIFASYPAQCIVMHLTGSVPFSLSASMDGRNDDYDRCQVITHNGFALIYDGCSGGCGGIQFCAAVRAAAKDGEITRCGSILRAENVTEITLVFAVHTSYYHPHDDLEAMVLETADTALHTPYDLLKQAHFDDYYTLYNRAQINLPDEPLAASIPTDQLLEAVKNGDEHALNAILSLYFCFGRYLMIAGSREGSLPLNLQGIWNVDMLPAWGSRYTVNINTEMNYWIAESCNLSECHLPLFTLLRRVMENGRYTAREMYGLDGFCCHHNTDLWGDTAPQDLWMPATLWATGGAWLALDVMEHYRYTLDCGFLAKHFDILYQAALFFSQYLTENGNGQLVTCPSVSPENTYLLPNGEKGCLCIGPSMDSQIITELYRAVIEADSILGLNNALIPTLEEQLRKIPQPQIGKYGQIMEWAEDYDEAEPGHRHISQLFALHPAHQISQRRTPELAKAAAATLQRRLSHGSGHTGWSCAWIANMYARLGKSEKMLSMLKKLIQRSTCPNLFDMHPPFQIDGNFGGASAIAEALVRSEPDGITLLPACPAAWQAGSFRGLRTYGGFDISADWAFGKLRHAKIISKYGGTCRIYLPENTVLHLRKSDAAAIRKEADGSLCFETVRNGVYHLTDE